MKDTAPSGVTAFVANRALDFNSQGLPGDVLETAKHCLLDWFGTTLAGWHHPATVNLACLLAEDGGSEQATLLGSGERVCVSHAALINGTASHVLDFDDTHLPSRVHPSVPLWPAILAYCEYQRLTGADALAAFVAGVEVQSRLAAVMGESHYRKGWHNTATLGTFGATAAISRLRRLDHNQLCHALGIAATQAGGLRAVFGTSCKSLHAGRAAANGLFAAGLAQQGFDSRSDIFDMPGGYTDVCADDVFALAAAHDPERWHVRDIVFKYHASCYGTQAPIEAALKFGRAIEINRVDHIKVFVEPQYLSICDIATPQDALQAKFSIRHMMALVLSGNDTVGDGGFTHEALTSESMAAWRNKIRVSGDSSLCRANVRAELQLLDGSRSNVSADASRPETDLALRAERLCQKSMALLDGTYSSEALETLHARILRIDTEPDVGSWMSETIRVLGQGRMLTKSAGS